MLHIDRDILLDDLRRCQVDLLERILNSDINLDLIKDILNIMSKNEDDYIKTWKKGKTVSIRELRFQMPPILNYKRVREYHEIILYYNEFIRS